MKDVLELREFFKRHEGEELALCTIVEKIGSGYRGLFAKKLVSLSSAASVGILSGGCLEKEIETLARESEHFPFRQSFSTASAEDRLFGYQKGCSGVIHVLFERLLARPELLDLYFPFGAVAPAPGVSVSLDEPTLGKREFVRQKAEGLLEPWTKPVELTIVGCGVDADPYLELAKLLGWSIRFVDYRREFTSSDRFRGETEAELLPLEKIVGSIASGPRSAVVLMTHSYESDLHILSQMLERPFGYLGLLGPRSRYELLKRDLLSIFGKAPSSEWEKAVVHAPPGITSNEHSPTQIAFSVTAEIHLCLREVEDV